VNIRLFLNFVIIVSCILIGVGCVKFSEAEKQKILLNKQLHTQEKSFFEVDDNLKRLR